MDRVAADLRAGKIIGTAALFSILAREPLGLLGPAPFDGELDDPSIGVIGGFGEMQQVDPATAVEGRPLGRQNRSGPTVPVDTVDADVR